MLCWEKSKKPSAGSGAAVASAKEGLSLAKCWVMLCTAAGRAAGLGEGLSFRFKIKF